MASSKVFVGNFSFEVGDEQLAEYFSQVGSVVSAKVMKDGIGGKSRGFGFVEFESPDVADKAIDKLDGSNWDGRVIKVSEDKTQKSRERQQEEQQDANAMPIGYFRAQPLDLGIQQKRRKKADPFLSNTDVKIDYKNTRVLRRFMSEKGRVLPRRLTGLTSANQRHVTQAIRRAQVLGLLPYVRQ